MARRCEFLASRPRPLPSWAHTSGGWLCRDFSRVTSLEFRDRLSSRAGRRRDTHAEALAARGPIFGSCRSGTPRSISRRFLWKPHRRTRPSTDCSSSRSRRLATFQDRPTGGLTWALVEDPGNSSEDHPAFVEVDDGRVEERKAAFLREADSFHWARRRPSSTPGFEDTWPRRPECGCAELVTVRAVRSTGVV